MDAESSEEDTCCLVWLIRERDSNTEKELLNFHVELQNCTELFGATTLELGGTSGVIRCEGSARSQLSEEASSADTAVRLGQLLCRWSFSHDPPICLKVGVHCGSMKSLQIPGRSFAGCYGPAVSRARRLAEAAPDHWVHFLDATKDRLRLFEGLPLNCSEVQGAFFLEPWVEASDSSDLEMGKRLTQRVSHARPSMASFSQDAVASLTNSQVTLAGLSAETSLAEFEKILTSFRVDISRFGKGHAKTIAEFHREVCQSRKSYLIDRDGELERCLELVRISLCVKDPQTGQDRTLRVAMEILEDGRTRKRNQKLAAVVSEGSTSDEAVRACFVERFGVSEELQDELFVVEMSWFKEEKSVSPSIPGIKTTYLTHEVRVRITELSRKEMGCLGLPACAPFSTVETTKGDPTPRKMSWAWTAGGEEASNEEMLTKLFEDHGINASEFESGAFAELIEEYESKACVLMVNKGELIRDLHIVKVWLAADVLSVPRVLVISWKFSKGKQDMTQKDRPISMRMFQTQTWEEGVHQVIQQRLGLDDEFQTKHIFIDQGTYRLYEEIQYSHSYPGLKSRYHIHEVTCRVQEAHPLLGLPEGLDVAFSRARRPRDNNVIITHFTWKEPKELFGAPVGTRRSFAKGLTDSATPVPEDADVADPKRKVPSPSALTLPEGSAEAGGLRIAELMREKKTDWSRARNAAKRIRDEDYHVGMFLDDCTAAFPELTLYICDGTGETSSGRSADDEYQRTVAALFAVYWLMRIGGDGAQSFAFGVDAEWRPLDAESVRPPRRLQAELEKRKGFLEQVNWSLFTEVFVAAGIQMEDGGHEEERTLAMIVLTVIHDVMKIVALCPVVEAARGEWAGYKEGELISDHDLALGYVLEHHPQALPSIAGLPESSQDIIKFTQCKMEFNMGWLVQAEAPPGALFRTFKQMVTSGSAAPRDIAFYFVHWLTDLAGAVPFPLEGCEMFVLKFPQRVLGSFLDSFKYVKHLSSKTETEVLEDYLAWRWSSLARAADISTPVPFGAGSIATMRLSIMCNNPSGIMDEYENLIPHDRRVLDIELARTGLRMQAYARDNLEEWEPTAGPAFLVYYAPALLCKNSSDLLGAMQVLAEVLRRARELWPLDESAGDDTVTLRIDALKDLAVAAMQQLKPGEFWALQRSTSKDAQVLIRNTMASKEGEAPVDWKTTKLLALGTLGTKETGVRGSMSGVAPTFMPLGRRGKHRLETFEPSSVGEDGSPPRGTGVRFDIAAIRRAADDAEEEEDEDEEEEEDEDEEEGEKEGEAAPNSSV